MITKEKLKEVIREALNKTNSCCPHCELLIRPEDYGDPERITDEVWKFFLLNTPLEWWKEMKDGA